MKHISRILLSIVLMLVAASASYGQTYNNRGDLKGKFTDNNGTEFEFYIYNGDLVCDIEIYRTWGAEQLRVRYLDGVAHIKGTGDEPCDITIKHVSQGHIMVSGTIGPDDYTPFELVKTDAPAEPHLYNNSGDLYGKFSDKEGGTTLTFHMCNGRLVCDVFAYRLFGEDNVNVTYSNGSVRIWCDSDNNFNLSHVSKGVLRGSGTILGSSGSYEFKRK